MTRQQLVTILYRYAEAMGYDVSASGKVLDFSDASALQEYAVPAMQWACGEGILGGYTDGTLKPQQEASRAQIVQILMSAMDVLDI